MKPNKFERFIIRLKGEMVFVTEYTRLEELINKLTKDYAIQEKEE